MEGLQFIGGKGAGLGSRSPLQALAFRGRSGSLLGAPCACGVSPVLVLPQESRTFRSNQMECFL